MSSAVVGFPRGMWRTRPLLRQNPGSGCSSRGSRAGQNQASQRANTSSGQASRLGRRHQSTESNAKSLPQPQTPPEPKSLPAPGPPKEDPIPIPNNVSTLPMWQRLGPLTRAAEGYARAQRNRPYVTQVCSSLTIAFFADIAVQRLNASFVDRPEEDEPGTTATAVAAATAAGEARPPPTQGGEYDPFRTMRSLVVGAISAIPTYRWFMFLSHNFNYSSHLVSVSVKVMVNQLCYTPVYNSYFFGMQALLAGDTPREAFERVCRAVPISFANALKLWPAVTAFSFTFIPMDYRSVFSGVIAIGWQTYLVYLNRTAELAGVKKRRLSGEGKELA